MLEIPSISKEYLHVPVTGQGDVDSFPVEIAVIPNGQEEPAGGDWHTAQWDGTDAKILIGPGTDVELDDGTYQVWVRLTATPEVPAIHSGPLRIT